MTKPSLIEQRQAVESLISCALLDEQPSPRDIENAKEAVVTMGFIDRNPDLLRAVTILMREFPDSQVEVR
jgi:hypothetical protein